MKKTFVFSGLTWLFVCGQIFAQSLFEKHERFLTDPQCYICLRAGEKIKVDGELDEASWKNATETAPFVDISGKGFPAPKFLTTAKMLWDDDFLYVAAEMNEPNLQASLTEHDSVIYRENDFEVFLDPDGDGKNYFEIEVNALGTIFDLMLDKPYRVGGNFFTQWDCPGLKVAVKLVGTLNDSSDSDRGWTVEMAIPRKALTLNFDNPLQAGKCWRVNFSRVQWLKKDEREENWVWSPTGKIDMHMPDRWGYVYFSEKTAETPKKREDFSFPYPQSIYKLLWAMFYEQRENFSRNQNYLRAPEQFFLTEKETVYLPGGTKLAVEATQNAFRVMADVSAENKRYSVNEQGEFRTESLAPRRVKNWVWLRIDKNRSTQEWRERFARMKACGISAALFEGYEEAVYRLCREAGLEAHYWRWTLNRSEFLETHPEWYAVNRLGESSHDKPAYVDYYRFLCPSRPEVAATLARSYLEDANLPFVDGVHLDYIRYPDVVLPVGLWKNYGIEQTRENPQYDYCYCAYCRDAFKKQSGKDPLELEFPMENQMWLNFRYDAIGNVADTIARRVKGKGKFISAAVFPGPSMARRMVRQDWGRWTLDAFFPMIYNGFYNEGAAWIGRSVKESVDAVGGRAQIYAGLMFPDIKGDFEACLDAAFDNGAAGVAFFDGPDDAYLLRLKSYLQKRGFEY
ncbi:MAG: hypothetical protein IJX22_04940 [Opitutales bacterium]|nr:hypothetical protein [Opitutales bacterium]